MYNFQMNKVYSFNTLAPAILGASIRNAKLISIMDYNTALSYDNVDLKFRTVYPALPIGTPDTPESSVYYRFKSESGENIVIADIWIDEASVEIIEHIRFQATFEQSSLSDMTRVRNALNALGITNYVIKQL